MNEIQIKNEDASNTRPSSQKKCASTISPIAPFANIMAILFMWISAAWSKTETFFSNKRRKVKSAYHS